MDISKIKEANSLLSIIDRIDNHMNIKGAHNREPGPARMQILCYRNHEIVIDGAVLERVMSFDNKINELIYSELAAFKKEIEAEITAL